jgi:nucleoside-diphosphate-sugar epimerase
MPEQLTDWSALHGNFFGNLRVLVTGGAGFIGSHLAQALAMLGASVIVLDDLSGGSEQNLHGIGKVEFLRGSILDVDTLRRCVAGCRFVLHQAALGSVPASIDDPRRYHDVNVTGTLNVLEASRKAKVQRVLFAASSAAYGDSEVLPKVETMPVLPKSPYAANKVAAEALMRAYSSSFTLDTASLRYFNIFGPRQNANSAYAAVIAAFAKAMIAGQPPTIFGDGQQSRDFTFVDNVVHANLLACRSTKPLSGEVLNIACGGRITINDLAKVMAQILGKHPKPIYAAERVGDVKHSLADITRARQLLGYEPIVDFPTGLAPTVAWYKTVLG